ncbi:MAG TPA: hypothetical protein VK870_04965, partial [Ignavibacteriaceae bacterium]|nr:hypothetical protein [Ignavibacteriaceae bacterium]
MNRILFAVFLIIFISPQLLFAQPIKKENNPFADKYLLSIDGGVNLGYTDFRQTLPDYIIRGNFEYLFGLGSRSALGLRAHVSSGYISAEDYDDFILTRADNLRT